MQATTNITDDELRELGKVSGIEAESAAIRQLIESAMMLERRREMVERYISGESGVEYEGYEETMAREAELDREAANRWRAGE